MVVSQHNHAMLCYEYAIKQPTISWVNISKQFHGMLIDHKYHRIFTGLLFTAQQWQHHGIFKETQPLKC